MAEVPEEQYKHGYILTLIKYIYGLVKEEHFWFKEYIKTNGLQGGFQTMQ